MDLYALGADYWTLDINQSPLLADDPRLEARIDSGLFACCMALRTFSPCIRYSGSSRRAQAVASALVKNHDAADRRDSSGKKNRRIPDTDLVLVLDRMDDIRTPLLVPWTYAAMLHEFLGNACNVVDGDACLAPDSDPFFVTHQYVPHGHSRIQSAILTSLRAGTPALPRWQVRLLRA